MRRFFHGTLLMAAILPLLAACASDTTGRDVPIDNAYDKQGPSLYTDPGTLPVTGKEPYSPDSPGFAPERDPAGTSNPSR